MTVEKHFRSVSRAASQRLGILGKSWRVFHDRLVLGRSFRSLLLPVLEKQCGARLQILGRVVKGASFFTGGVFECDIAHR